jgi:hypothetical protein
VDTDETRGRYADDDGVAEHCPSECVVLFATRYVMRGKLWHSVKDAEPT